MDWHTSTNVQRQKEIDTVSSFPLNCPIQPPRLYCPKIADIQPLHFNEIQMDPILINNIQLLKYIQDLEYRIEDLRSVLKKEIPSYYDERLSNIPEIIGLNITDMTNNSIHFRPTDLNSQLKNAKAELTYTSNRIDDKLALSLIKRSVVAICLNSGINNCSCSTLDCLTDICREYLTNLCLSLNQLSNRKIADIDPISLALLNNGIQCEQELIDFYSKFVITFNKRLKCRISKLTLEYESQVKKNIE